MFQPLRVPLELHEFEFRKKHPNATDSEIREYISKAPYTKEEVDEYMTSEQRKNSPFLQRFKK